MNLCKKKKKEENKDIALRTIRELGCVFKTFSDVKKCLKVKENKKVFLNKIENPPYRYWTLNSATYQGRA